VRIVGWAAVSLCAVAACGGGSKGRDAAAGGGGSGGVVVSGGGGARGGIGGASGGAAGSLGGAAGAIAGVGGAGRGGGAGGNAGRGGSGSGGNAGRGGGAGGNAGAGGAGLSDAGTAPDAADGGLPACEITTRPADPTNAGADGGLITSSSGKCNSIVLTGPWINRGCFDRQGDGGVLDGGFVEGPAGGTIRDGDYEVVSADGSLSVGQCPADYKIGTTRRGLRVFGGGTYIEWGAVNRNTANDVDTNIWYDTTMRAAGHTLTFVSYDCGDTFVLKSYGYTARDDDFTYFAYAGNADGVGDLQTIVRYRRTCQR